MWRATSTSRAAAARSRCWATPSSTRARCGRPWPTRPAAGWHTETVKYGRRLTALFERDGGEALRARIDRMGNEEFQRLLRADGGELRERLPDGDGAVARLVTDLDDQALRA